MTKHKKIKKILLILAIIEIDQIRFDQIERCVGIIKLELDHDKLFEEIIKIYNQHLKSYFLS